MSPRIEQEHHLPTSRAKSRVADLNSDLAVIITHPWGPLGGNMHNNVVLAAALFFQALGVTTMRFDFATSQIGRGYREVEQVIEAAEFLLSGGHMSGSSESSSAKGGKARRRIPSSILLCGYSYGSLITGSASAKIPRCVGCVSIAPPIAVRHWLLLFNSKYHVQEAVKRTNLPRLMVIGEEDNFSSEKHFLSYLESFPAESTSGAAIKGADHFFAGREKDLMNVVGRWLLATYKDVLGGDLKRLGKVDLAEVVPSLRSSPAGNETNDLLTQMSEEANANGDGEPYVLWEMSGCTPCAD